MASLSSYKVISFSTTFSKITERGKREFGKPGERVSNCLGLGPVVIAPAIV